jgi:hypothetical protein
MMISLIYPLQKSLGHVPFSLSYSIVLLFDCSPGIPCYIASGRTSQKTRVTCYQECAFICSLPSSGSPSIAESVTSGVFNHPLPSNGHMRHNILPPVFTIVTFLQVI